MMSMSERRLTILHTSTYFTIYICILCILNAFEQSVLDEAQCYMKGSFVHSDLIAEMRIGVVWEERHRQDGKGC